MSRIGLHLVDDLLLRLATADFLHKRYSARALRSPLAFGCAESARERSQESRVLQDLPGSLDTASLQLALN